MCHLLHTSQKINTCSAVLVADCYLHQWMTRFVIPHYLSSVECFPCHSLMKVAVSYRTAEQVLIFWLVCNKWHMETLPSQSGLYSGLSSPSSTSSLWAHAHASCPLSIPFYRLSLKVWVLSGRSIAACPWPYLRRLETKNRRQISGLRGWNSALECRPRVRVPGCGSFSSITSFLKLCS